jgi:hypothetical protein
LKQIILLRHASAALACLAGLIAVLTAQQWALAAFPLLLGAAAWRLPAIRWRPASALVVTGWVLLAFAAAWLKVLPQALLPMLIFAIAAWDLADFQKRISGQPETEELAALVRRHFRLLGFLLVAGLVLGMGVLYINVQVSFWLLVALAVIAAVSLRWLVEFMRK